MFKRAVFQMNSDISVVIPYYNDFNQFERCITSVLRQTLKPAEVLVIDDCSDDSSLLIGLIDKIDFATIKIEYIRNASNKNGAYSRNLGIKNASGQFIALLDADDYWDDGHLEKSYQFLCEGDFDFIYGNVIIDRNGLILKKQIDDINKFVNKFDLLVTNPPQTNSFFFRRNISNNVKFDESLRRHQDFQFLFSAISEGISIGYIDVYSSYYCLSERSLSVRFNIDSSLEFWSRTGLSYTNVLLQRKLIDIMRVGLEVDNNHTKHLLDNHPLFSFVKKKIFLRFLLLNYRNQSILKLFILLYLRDFQFLKIKLMSILKLKCLA
jgi:glycosyltransferase involved in cell wall biosynthesis